MAQSIASISCEDLVLGPSGPRRSAAGDLAGGFGVTLERGPIAIARNPWDAISVSKFLNESPEFEQAPLPHDSSGSFFSPILDRSLGRYTVCVGRPGSCSIIAGYGPDPSALFDGDCIAIPGAVRESAS